MSALIRSDQAKGGDVRRLAAALAPPQRAAAVVEPPRELTLLRREVEELTHALAARDAEISRLREDVAKAQRDGEAMGRKVGLAEADTGREQALEMLAGGLDAALDQHAERLASLEGLAALLARAALRRVLGASDAEETLTGRIIRRTVEGLEGSTVLRIEAPVGQYSQADLEALAIATGRPGVEAVATPDLKPGECRIRLTLGALEVGVGQQLAAFETLLGTLATEGQTLA